MLKTCTKCKKEYIATLEFFYKQKKGKDGLLSQCKNCRREYSKKYNEENPEKYKENTKKWQEKNKEYLKEWRKKNKENRKIYQLKRRFRISIEEYNQMFNKQNGRCAICGIHQLKLKRTLCVDHNHKTKEIRELLCVNCNIGIGHLKENPFILLKTIKYLKKHLDNRNIEENDELYFNNLNTNI